MSKRVTEQTLENNLTKWVKAEGGIALKGSNHFDTGFPDREVFLVGTHAYVELKGTSKYYHLTPKQTVWAGRIIAAGGSYFIIESLEQLELFKERVYTSNARYSKHSYSLNGFNLTLNVDPITKTFYIVSNRNGQMVKILEAPIEQTPVHTVYKAFLLLHQKYPNTNYEDM